MNFKDIYYAQNISSGQLDEILVQAGGKDAIKGALIYLAESDSGKLDIVQQYFSHENIVVVGGVVPAVIFESSFYQQGMVVALLPEYPRYLLVESPADENCPEKVASLFEPSSGEQNDFLFMMFDAMVPNIETILQNIYQELADDVNYIGVNVGSETFQPIPVLFDNKRFIQGGMLAMRMTFSKAGIVEHGYAIPEIKQTATSASGNKITSIEWRPAFDVYTEMVKKEYNEDINRDNFYEKGGVHFPFGIIRADGTCLVRIPVALEDDGALFCVGEIPENSVLTMLKAIEKNDMTMVNNLISQLEKHTFTSLMFFYCAGRRMHLGDTAENELNQLKSSYPDNKIWGAVSLGEIGGSAELSYPLFHNAALVAMPID